MPLSFVVLLWRGSATYSHISNPELHVEIEPHAIWRRGNFKYLDDETYSVNKRKIDDIREKLLEGVNKKYFIEKSPINSLRPNLVHAVFPDAKIIYVERNIVDCVKSNVLFSQKGLSFNLKILASKYLGLKQKNEIHGAVKDNNLNQRKILDQINPKNY